MNRAPHTNCTHAATKSDRRRCRTATRRTLEGMTVADLRAMARTLDVQGRSAMNRDELIAALAFDPRTREACTAPVAA